MTKDELKQLAFLKGEVAMLEIQIEEVKKKINKYRTSDSVKASQTEFPYTQHSVLVSGIPEKSYSGAWELRKELAELKLRLQAREAECDWEYIRLNNYIQSIDDSLIRQILTYKFIENLEWEEVATRISNHDTENSVRKKFERFLKKI